jgi:nucleotide-binding universal stress UspA family protein
MTGIVVGVDGSAGAAGALVWAAREARLRAEPLTAVMAWGLLDQPRMGPDDRFDPRFSDADALANLSAHVERALEAPHAAVLRRAVCDLPARALLEASEGASILVVGARGLGGFRGLLLGSVSQQCVNHAKCPIAVVRDHEPTLGGETMERIVVGIDGSETSQRALEWAAEEARLRGASLEVVHAWHMPYLGVYPMAGTGLDPTAFEEAARETLEVAIGGLATSEPTVQVEQSLLTGSAATAILESAKGADLVVIGSRGLGGFAGLLLGSVSQQVVHHATCPVVVVPLASEPR